MMQPRSKFHQELGQLEWGVLMNVVSRHLERVGDNVVDTGEQVAFLLTGEFRGFTDASHDDDAPIRS